MYLFHCLLPEILQLLRIVHPLLNLCYTVSRNKNRRAERGREEEVARRREEEREVERTGMYIVLEPLNLEGLGVDGIVKIIRTSIS